MRSGQNRIFGIVCAGLSLLLLVPAVSMGSDWEGTPAYELIGQYVDQIVINDLTQRFGEDYAQTCIETRDLALCIHPDTPPEQMDEILRRLPTWTGDRYNWGGRWTVTATDGSTGAWGNPITLTYSFVPDGVWIPGGAGEPGSANSIHAEMNSHFGSAAVWKPFFAEHFDGWGQHIGITYVEVSDDGAAFPNMPGVLGSRGDVRLAAHHIDGYYGVLAYNYFPTQGDMVMDTGENWGAANNDYVFFRNVVMHEHGHGHGLGHVNPTSCTKLMEPNYCSNFTGPQDDDIRGGMRNYGDFMENDDDYSEAHDLGAFTGDLSFQTISLDNRTDEDWFEFQVTAGSELDVTIDPIGFAYQVDGQVIWTYKVQDLRFELRNGANGSNVLIFVNDTIEGVDEVLTDYALSPGTHYIRVFSAADQTNDVQRYDLHLNLEITDPTAAPGGTAPVAGLGMQVFPNPFNPKTMARFYAPEAGTVSMKIFNVAGGLVRNIEATASAAGWMSIEWNGLDDAGQGAPSGVYFMNASAGDRSETVRAVLLK